VGSVAQQLTSQFAQCLSCLLEAEGAEAETEAAPIKPVGGVRLTLRAIWSVLFRPFWRR
jgi:hypothetical protein